MADATKSIFVNKLMVSKFILHSYYFLGSCITASKAVIDI